MTRLKTMLTALALSAALLGPAQTLAYEGDDEHGMQLEYLTQELFEELDDLELSDEQKQQVQSLESEFKAMRRSMQSSFTADLVAVLESPEFETEAVEQLLARHRQLQHRHQLQALEAQHKIYQVLDSNQRAELQRELSEDEEHGDDEQDGWLDWH